jgi:hypothetical protein
VLPLRRPAEMQLLGQRHEVAKLAQLHTRRQVRVRPILVLRPGQETLTTSLLPRPGSWNAKSAVSPVTGS